MTRPIHAPRKTAGAVHSAPDERDLIEIITVLKANIDAPNAMFSPRTSFTKGQLAYIVEILEQYQRTEAKRT